MNRRTVTHRKLSAASIEAHSIDFVPLSERYGTPRRLFTIWSSANLTILGVALGTLGVGAGLGLVWALIGLAVGNAAGTIVMAAHSAQGPHLGVPQMIQSRAQFGVLGAAVPLVAVAIMYLLYCAANDLLIPPTLKELFHLGDTWALCLFSGITLLIAICGYELIHRIAAILSLVSTVFFASAAILLLRGHASYALPHATVVGHFDTAVFGLTLTQAAAWSLTYGPYVADYSRYLPPNVSRTATFWYTACGNFFGSQLVMSFGACLAQFDPKAAKNPALALAGVFGFAKPVALLVICSGVVLGNVLNLYSAYLASITILAVRRKQWLLTRKTKVMIMSALTATAAAVAAAFGKSFDKSFADALNIMMYLLIPWSAINLVDYYFVRRGHYDVSALYRLDGEYGSWQWRTLAAFVMGLLVQLPFISLSYYTGPVGRLSGIDLAWLPGLLVSGIAYFVVQREVRLPADSWGTATWRPTA